MVRMETEMKHFITCRLSKFIKRKAGFSRRSTRTEKQEKIKCFEPSDTKGLYRLCLRSLQLHGFSLASQTFFKKENNYLLLNDYLHLHEIYESKFCL